MTSSYAEYQRSRQLTTNPVPVAQTAAAVVVGNITYRPLTRYEITFEVQPDPRDARIAELERALEAALAQNGHTAEAQL